MTYISTVKSREVAIDNAKALCRDIKSTGEKQTRNIAALSIALADAMTFAAEKNYLACQETLKEVVKSVVARNEKNEADADETRALLKMAGNACKFAMLLLDGEKTGVVAGYRRNDSRDYVDAATYAGMNKQAQDRHSPEIFWDGSKTFTGVRQGKDIVKRSSDILIPTVNEALDAYRVHFGGAEVEKSGQYGYKVKSAERPEGEGINSQSDAKRHIAYLTAWVKDGNLLTLDDKQAAQYAKLADIITGALKERENANSQADELEAVA